MRRSSLSLLLVLLTAPAQAQVQPGDLLMSSLAFPDVLVHYRPGGKVVQTTGKGTGTLWRGAAILPDGNWVTTYPKPRPGVSIFDGVTGKEIATWSMPYSFSWPGDVGVFSDGTIAVVDQRLGLVWRFDVDGKVIAKWSVSPSPFGILVDGQDHVWTCDFWNGRVWHTDDQGNKLGQFPTGNGAGDVTMAADGTLFVALRGGGVVAHHAQDGTFLGSFVGTGSLNSHGIAMGADQTLWVTGESEKLMRNFDQTGKLLGSFDLGPAGLPTFLTIPLVDAEDIGTNYCGPAVPNSTGQPAVISAFGSTKVAYNSVSLTAGQLPPNVFGYFLNSDLKGFRPLAPGGQGVLCLGGNIGRHVGQVADSGAAGELVIDLDLGALPRPGGMHSVVAGETWNFQCWFRDANPSPTSNFTDGIEVVFR